MMNWAKQQLANVAGTQEPIYGPSAIKSVAEQAKATPYTELKRGDIKWAVMESTCVETQSFYMTADSGHLAMAQIIYSNVMGVRTTCMFNTKIYYPDSSQPFLWSSDSLSNVEFSDDKTSFYAENVASELSLDGKSYSIKSMNNEVASVNLTITQTTPGFVVGKDGKSVFGTDLSEPWGSISHSFWPRNTAEGTIVTKDGPIDFKGTAILIHALQGMKPHHAASRWKSADFKGPTYSAVIVDFITPASYGSTKVTVGGIVKDGEIICAGTDCAASHPTTKLDSENEWPTPETARFEWKGTTKDGKSVQAVVEGPLGEQLDRVDVMAEIPGFVKSIIAGTVGTKPYIYQYHSKELILKMKIGDEEIVEKGSLFSEASFISE